ncbi:MAG: amino acid dehydrogenase [Gemmatimonadetes bacterium]|nr:amino acid dehydrogenase [Gemmatimonadota bacterium]
MIWTELFRAWPGEEVVVRYDRDAEAWMFVAIHSTRGKRSVGGCRLKVYPTPEDGLWDAIRLAEGMTNKWAAIDVDYGGGKAVIALSRPVAGEARTALLRRFGRMIDSLNGRYGTGPDIGTTPDDMALLASVTRYVHCYDWIKRAPYDPGIYTALGVFVGIKSAWRFVTGSDDLRGVRVLVQGVGDTGAPLARSLAKAGAVVLLNDLNPDKLDPVAKELGAETVPAEAVYRTPCDVYAPCSVGATLDETTIPQLTCRVIAGAANNQLRSPEDGDRLVARGILYAPDYVVNGAGAVSLAMVDEGAGFDAIEREIQKMDQRLTEIFQEAKARGESPVAAAARRVERRLGVAQ